MPTNIERPAEELRARLQRYREFLKGDSANPSLALEVAELHLRLGELAQAESVLATALASRAAGDKASPRPSPAPLRRSGRCGETNHRLPEGPPRGCRGAGGGRAHSPRCEPPGPRKSSRRERPGTKRRQRGGARDLGLARPGRGGPGRGERLLQPRHRAPSLERSRLERNGA